MSVVKDASINLEENTMNEPTDEQKICPDCKESFYRRRCKCGIKMVS